MKNVGVTGILCVLGDSICEETGSAVSALDHALRGAAPVWLTETVPSYTSLLVRFDPMLVDEAQVRAELELFAAQAADAKASRPRTIVIPVCYGGDLGPDLQDVADMAGLTAEEVIRIHSSRFYRIHMLGFLPGFPYLGGLDERLYAPRLDTPRMAIPAGSVGIGGQQTGIYPMVSPGGWRLIGRTPLTLFDPEAPLPYQAGDLIRFVPISREVFDGWEVIE